jgi:hypothetical protein
MVFSGRGTDELDAFVNSFLATFGGKASPRAVFTVTPTPGSTASQYVQTPVGMLSVFAFQTPIPYPFGDERTGYLVTDIFAAVKAARAAGANILVEPFDDPIGKDAIIQWPGGLTMQLYWHTTDHPPAEHFASETQSLRLLNTGFPGTTARFPLDETKC